ncbi:MAG: hypothetical protein A2Z96_07250 [Spirochaetes bacterium GWB1_48_6]|nr:MAG: hypothetical protein A2Z96_07250 [Spirochaetes bacterium GWB1_48_6]
MFLEAEVWTIARTDKGNAVLIRPLEGTLAVPIFIGSLEAQNILLGMGDMEIPRPLTHDLMLSILQLLGSEVVQVEIHTIKDGTFFANIVLMRDGGRTAVDARPSDALALAVRTHCPVFIDEAIVEEVGIPVSSVKSGETHEPLAPETPGKSEKQDLEEALAKSVAEENYEEAARLRDRLKKLES